jgi:hypothetical protein
MKLRCHFTLWDSLGNLRWIKCGLPSLLVRHSPSVLCSSTHSFFFFFIHMCIGLGHFSRLPPPPPLPPTLPSPSPLHPLSSTSTEELIFWGHLPYLSSGQALPWRLDFTKFLHTPHWDVSWPTLGPSTWRLILNHESSFFSVIRHGPNTH